MDNVVSVGERVRELRLKKFITLKSLSNSIGTSTAVLQRFEAKDGVLGGDLLNRIADILDVSVDYLKFGDGYEEVSNEDALCTTKVYRKRKKRYKLEVNQLFKDFDGNVVIYKGGEFFEKFERNEFRLSDEDEE